MCARVSRVSRVCPGSPRCLFTGTVYRQRANARFPLHHRSDHYQHVNTSAPVVWQERTDLADSSPIRKNSPGLRLYHTIVGLAIRETVDLTHC
jgi:hypothetical protein